MPKETPMVNAADVIDLPLLNRGKVREMFFLRSWLDHLLLVATDRISAFDEVLPDPIVSKGEVLTKMSNFWFWFFRDECANHLTTVDVRTYPTECKPFLDVLRDRSMIVRKHRVIPFECIVRGRLSGSFYSAFKKAEVIRQQTESPLCNKMCKNVHGFLLPADMQESEAFPEPIFTPSTKAEKGAHDENISFEIMSELLLAWMVKDHVFYQGGNEALAEDMRELCLRLYSKAYAYALERGIVIADTKFELGLTDDGRLVLVDEVLTPDSSRFWPADRVVPGKTPPSFDKQPVRDWLKAHWLDRTQPPPRLPEQIIEETSVRYAQIYHLLTS